MLKQRTLCLRLYFYFGILFELKKCIYIEKNVLSYFKPQTVCFNLIKTRKTNKVPQHAAESKITQTSWVHISRWTWTLSRLLRNVNLGRKKRRPRGKSQIQACASDTVTQHVETRNKKRSAASVTSTLGRNHCEGVHTGFRSCFWREKWLEKKKYSFFHSPLL